MKKINSFFVLILLSGRLFAQTTLDNNPTSLKWYQINTTHFRVLYPTGFDEQAQRMANTLEHIHGPEAATLGTKPRKISVVLQNQSTVSNGFVSITPRRSEFFAMPSQNYNFLGTNDWLNLLASHEYRHVVQYQHAFRGFNKLFYYLFGANTLAAMSHVAAPQWFWEGDAVATETAFTHSGRGRIPNFGLVFKTNLLEGRTFNYQKQYLRSYKNNIPDHYVLGYHMVSYLRKRTNDPEIWGKITARSWSVPFIPFTFSSAIKKESGLYVNALYKAMAADLKKDWQAEIDKLQLTSFKTINPRKSKAYTDYQYPQPFENGTVLAMKKGIGDIEKFCILKDGKELKGFTPGIINGTGMLSTANSKVVWNEFGYDPRWGVRSYSLIKTYDLKKKRKRVIGSKNERYAGAALSPNGALIVTVRTDTQYKTSIVVLDYNTGKELKNFANPENYFFSMPRWSDDGKRIASLKTTPQGRTVSVVDYESGSQTDLFPVTQENIGYPVLNGNYLFYNSAVSGIDNIYALDIQSNKKLQITTSKYGAYNPAISTDGKTIYYNEQTRNGFDVVETPFDATSWKEYEEKQTEIKPLSEYLAEQEGMANLLDSVPQHVLPIKRYSKLKGMINLYNWGGFIDNSLTRPSIGIQSQDILSTTALHAGYQFDINERTASWNAGLSYQGFFPILDLNFSAGSRKVDKGDYPLTTWKISQTMDTLKSTKSQSVKLQWKEQNVEAGLRIPLNLTHSKYYTHVSIANYAGYTHVTGFSNGVNNDRHLPAIIQYDTIKQNNQTFARQSLVSYYPFSDYVGNGNLIYNHMSISGYRLLKTSLRDIYSKTGQVLYLDLYNTPYGGNYSGRNFSVYTQLYFPGLFKHHSLRGYWAYQNTQILGLNLNSNQGLDNYTFRNQIPVPRGQSVSRFQDFYTMSANYALPLWYPDVHIGPLLNIQRVRLNTFFDYGFGKTKSKTSIRSQAYSSIGAELKFDINIMRFLPQFDIGFRYSKGISPSVSKFEVLIGTFNF